MSESIIPSLDDGIACFDVSCYGQDVQRAMILVLRVSSKGWRRSGSTLRHPVNLGSQWQSLHGVELQYLSEQVQQSYSVAIDLVGDREDVE